MVLFELHRCVGLLIELFGTCHAQALLPRCLQRSTLTDVQVGGELEWTVLLRWVCCTCHSRHVATRRSKHLVSCSQRVQ